MLALLIRGHGVGRDTIVSLLYLEVVASNEGRYSHFHIT